MSVTDHKRISAAEAAGLIGIKPQAVEFLARAGDLSPPDTEGLFDAAEVRAFCAEHDLEARQQRAMRAAHQWAAQRQRISGPDAAKNWGIGPEWFRNLDAAGWLPEPDENWLYDRAELQLAHDRLSQAEGGLVAACLAAENELLRHEAETERELAAVETGHAIKAAQKAAPRQYLREAYARLLEADDLAPLEDPKSDPRHRIRITGGAAAQAVSELERALVMHGPGPIYQRAGAMVHVKRIPVRLPDGGNELTHAIKSATAATIQGEADKVCRFEKYDKRQSKWVASDCPETLAKRYMEAAGACRLYSLNGIAACPTLRPDGSLLSRPGYDKETGLMLVADLPVSVPDEPTRKQAESALKTLRDLFVSFPFTGEGEQNSVAESVALAGLIGAVLRPSLPTVPGIAVTAPAAGTGKSYLANVISTVVTGGKMPSVNVGLKPEEFDKSLAAALLEGHQVVALGNIERPLRGALLAEAISEPRVIVRELGHSRTLTITSTTAIFATGNNLRVAGDLTRRFLTCELDAKKERPELRKFGGDPMAAAIRDRARLVSAVLTVVRFGLAQADPDPHSSFAGFQEWHRRVAKPLVLLGLPDPIGSLEQTRAGDDDAEELGALMAAWQAAFPDGATCRKAVANAGSDDLVEAIKAVASDRAGAMSSRSLGYYLRRVQGRVLDGRRFVVAAKTKQGMAFHVENCGEDAGEDG